MGHISKYHFTLLFGLLLMVLTVSNLYLYQKKSNQVVWQETKVLGVKDERQEKREALQKLISENPLYLPAYVEYYKLLDEGLEKSLVKEKILQVNPNITL